MLTFSLSLDQQAATTHHQLVVCSVFFYIVQAVGAAGLVVCIEPEPGAAAALRHNVKAHAEWHAAQGKQVMLRQYPGTQLLLQVNKLLCMCCQLCAPSLVLSLHQATDDQAAGVHAVTSVAGCTMHYC